MMRPKIESQLYDHGYRVDYERNMRDGGALHVEAARRLIREDGYDVVVFGHTHVEPHVLMRGGGTYINTGDCVQRRMYCSIDLKMRRCGLREFRVRRVPVERKEETSVGRSADPAAGREGGLSGGAA